MAIPRRVRVLIAEDSTTARELLVSICRSDPAIEVVGEATDGAAAVEMTTRLRPSLVLMDVHMPVMDGFAATKRIMIEAPTPIIIITAASNLRDVEISLRAIQLGALTALPKPEAPGTPNFDASARHLVRMVKALADVTVVRRRWLTGVSNPGGPVSPSPTGRPLLRLIAVAASTGGPAAVFRLLEHLPRDLAVPVVVVQHIADGFDAGLVGWLNSGSPLPVELARSDERLAPGRVYVAPTGRHVEVCRNGRVAMSGAPPVRGFRPSADVLFSSVATAYGPSAAGVVLTGMGSDGVDGLRELRERGGLVLAQDRETCVVFGMPGAAVEAGLTHVVAPVEGLAKVLSDLAERRADD